MSATAPTIPDALLRRVEAFLSAGTTGQIVWHVKDGRILKCEVLESYRVVDDEPVQLREAG